MPSISQLRKEINEIRRLATLQNSGDISQTIVYNPAYGTPDLSGITGTGTIICIPDNGRDYLADLWQGPYSPEPSGPLGGAMILNLIHEDCGEN